MTRNTALHVARALAAIASAAAMSSFPMAQAGGRGGDNGDSSMNPFTGDSYAYFHGGHNLGEQGTIRPDRPNPAWSAQKPDEANAKAAAASHDARATQARASATPEQAATR